MRDISELVQKQAVPPVKEMTAEELNRAAFLADLERLRDFRPEEERIRWSSPIAPKWRN